MLEHGGRLHAAARAYDIPLDDWLDLSTGINPDGWPVADMQIPRELWARLPETDDGLVAAASAYYGAPHILPIAGSQAAIQALPFLRHPSRVAILKPGYAEHAQAWQRAGHAVGAWNAAREEADLDNLDVLVLSNPNNPTGSRFEAAQLLDWHARLAARGGWLVIDEAFIDATPAYSLAPYCARPGLIVLRSLGKFFGLAGARVGFAMADESMLNELEESLGPWPIAGPARWLATKALADTPWQAATRAKLLAASKRLAQLLAAHDLPPSGGNALFQRVLTTSAADIRHRLALRGILVRRFDDPPSLRFGLPAGEENWTRLADALKEASA